MRMLLRCVTAGFIAGFLTLVSASMLSATISVTFAAEVFELEPDYVYGKNRKPRLGYHKPEVFDPLSDRLLREDWAGRPG